MNELDRELLSPAVQEKINRLEQTGYQVRFHHKVNGNCQTYWQAEIVMKQYFRIKSLPFVLPEDSLAYLEGTIRKLHELICTDKEKHE